ncbi:hypothetical protein SNE40_017096 [Patella caerulea]|uniref:Uncharacterized protein n=1 Tax=Patella caerulea TaxID=87958 RepID=A0AAN8JG43_PATCE
MKRRVENEESRVINVITKPTRLSNTKFTLIDPISIPSFMTYAIADTLDVPRFVSDHIATCIYLNHSMPSKRSFKRKICLYKRANFTALNDEINSFSWREIINDSYPIDNIIDKFDERIEQLISQYIPTKTITAYPNDKPWFNNQIRRQIRQRDIL